MTDFGVDFDCFDDAPSALYPTVTGVDLVKQELYHRFTTDAVLGWIQEDDGTISPDPAAENWGRDVRRELGRATTAESAAGLGPVYSEVAQRSARVQSADVAVTRTLQANGIVVLDMAVTGTTADGPFDFVFRVTAESVTLLTGEA